MGLSGSWHRPPANYNNDNNVSSFFILIFIQLNWLCGLEKKRKPVAWIQSGLDWKFCFQWDLLITC